MGRKHEEALHCARKSVCRLAQPDPLLPDDFSYHNGLGSDQHHHETMGVAGDGYLAAAASDSPILRRAPRPLAAGTEGMATPVGTGDPGLERHAPQKAYQGARRTWIAAFVLACCFLTVLVLAGLYRVSRGQGELMGQALPLPIVVREAPGRLEVHLYDEKIRLTIPPAWRNEAKRLGRDLQSAWCKCLAWVGDRSSQWLREHPPMDLFE